MIKIVSLGLHLENRNSKLVRMVSFLEIGFSWSTENES